MEGAKFVFDNNEQNKKPPEILHVLLDQSEQENSDSKVTYQCENIHQVMKILSKVNDSQG